MRNGWAIVNRLATGGFKVDANKVKFVLPLQPHEKRQFGYEVTTNFGSNATR